MGSKKTQNQNKSKIAANKSSFESQKIWNHECDDFKEWHLRKQCGREQRRK